MCKSTNSPMNVHLKYHLKSPCELAASSQLFYHCQMAQTSFLNLCLVRLEIQEITVEGENDCPTIDITLYNCRFYSVDCFSSMSFCSGKNNLIFYHPHTRISFSAKEQNTALALLPMRYLMLQSAFFFVVDFVLAASSGQLVVVLFEFDFHRTRHDTARHDNPIHQVSNCTLISNKVFTRRPQQRADRVTITRSPQRPSSVAQKSTAA